MSFNSIQFFLFFPIVTLIYFLLPYRFRWLHLLVASCIFYMYFIPKYILILFFTIVVDYIAGIYIEDAKGHRRKFLLSLSVIANVGVLCVFKYYNFFIGNIETAMQSLHMSSYSFPVLKYILPLGLSFHTFQAMSYTIEVYRGNQKAERHIGIYALYVMFYPQLVAGPIERPQNLLHQFHDEHDFVYADVLDGLKMMLWGLFKKVVIADSIGAVISPVFNNPHSFSSVSILIAVILFPFQLYCDFAGYSDIALGSAKVMGFKLKRNFNFPYIAQNMSDFWRRWHISLSTWLNDYLFTPLSISFRNWGKWGIIAALNITFLIAGLWHGANWNFIVFGLLNGIALSYDVFSRKFRKKMASAIPKAVYSSLSIVLTFLSWAIMLVFFRAASVGPAMYMLKQIPMGFVEIFNHSIVNLLTFNRTITLLQSVCILSLVVALQIAEYFQRKINLVSYLDRKPLLMRWGAYYLMIVAIICLANAGEPTFIYFQF